jgi:hypothetical protein
MAAQEEDWVQKFETLQLHAGFVNASVPAFLPFPCGSAVMRRTALTSRSFLEQPSA